MPICEECGAELAGCELCGGDLTDDHPPECVECGHEMEWCPACGLLLGFSRATKAAADVILAKAARITPREKRAQRIVVIEK